MAKTKQRRAFIRALVAAGGAKDHAAILAKLARAGFPSTQPTVSRDLKALGLVRGSKGWTGEREAAAMRALRALRDALFYLDN